MSHEQPKNLPQGAEDWMKSKTPEIGEEESIKEPPPLIDKDGKAHPRPPDVELN